LNKFKNNDDNDNNENDDEHPQKDGEIETDKTAGKEDYSFAEDKMIEDWLNDNLKQQKHVTFDQEGEPMIEEEDEEEEEEDEELKQKKASRASYFKSLKTATKKHFGMVPSWERGITAESIMSDLFELENHIKHSFSVEGIVSSAPETDPSKKSETSPSLSRVTTGSLEGGRDRFFDDGVIFQNGVLFIKEDLNEYVCKRHFFGSGIPMANDPNDPSTLKWLYVFPTEERKISNMTPKERENYTPLVEYRSFPTPRNQAMRALMYTIMNHPLGLKMIQEKNNIEAHFISLTRNTYKHHFERHFESVSRHVLSTVGAKETTMSQPMLLIEKNQKQQQEQQQEEQQQQQQQQQQQDEDVEFENTIRAMNAGCGGGGSSKKRNRKTFEKETSNVPHGDSNDGEKRQKTMHVLN
jgi:hypothetical protein